MTIRVSRSPPSPAARRRARGFFARAREELDRARAHGLPVARHRDLRLLRALNPLTPRRTGAVQARHDVIESCTTRRQLELAGAAEEADVSSGGGKRQAAQIHAGVLAAVRRAAAAAADDARRAVRHRRLTAVWVARRRPRTRHLRTRRRPRPWCPLNERAALARTPRRCQAPPATDASPYGASPVRELARRASARRAPTRTRRRRRSSAPPRTAAATAW